jgi:hypothetical protein
LAIYRHPGDGVKSVRRGAYFEWDGYNNAQIARSHGFTWYDKEVEGSLYSYENLDNLQTGLHDHLRFQKFGYSRACDIASNHIRRGMRRDVGVALVLDSERRWPATYLGVPYADILANIGMTVAEFEAVCERFTNKVVVEWASRPESFQCFYSTSAAASRADNSITIAA